jgi:hypothetical protein
MKMKDKQKTYVFKHYKTPAKVSAKTLAGAL